MARSAVKFSNKERPTTANETSDCQSKERTAGDLRSCLPFLKWPGGKRWLAPKIAKLLGEIEGTYFEPFLGGAAVFFHICPKQAVLSDSNEDLVNLYDQVKSNLPKLTQELSRLRPSKRRYLAFRTATPSTPIDRAVRFLYLNRTAFNGIYRVNRAGHFNVPYGCKAGTLILDRDALEAAEIALRNASLLRSDFEDQISKAKRGDVVYCDPPFTVKHDNNGFIRYNESIFSWNDQVRLSRVCTEAASRGARVLISNARHRPIRDLYSRFQAKVVKRTSMISADIGSRGMAYEYLFISDNMK